MNTIGRNRYLVDLAVGRNITFQWRGQKLFINVIVWRREERLRKEERHDYTKTTHCGCFEDGG